jgi:hypothetical protein
MNAVFWDVAQFSSCLNYRLHVAISQKIATFITTTVRASYSTRKSYAKQLKPQRRQKNIQYVSIKMHLNLLPQLITLITDHYRLIDGDKRDDRYVNLGLESKAKKGNHPNL